MIFDLWNMCFAKRQKSKIWPFFQELWECVWQVNMTSDWNFLECSWCSCHSGQTLFVDWPLFWALYGVPSILKKHIQSPLIFCLVMCCELNYLVTFHFMYSLTLHVIYFALSQVGWSQHRSPVYSITDVPVPSIIITILWPVVALVICELFKRRYIK